jgi:GT2 family glycosyltransferase
MELTTGVIRQCQERIGDYDALCIHERVAPGVNYWARARAVERDSCYKSFFCEAARCFRTDTFRALGGYDPSLVGLEDMDLQAKLWERGMRLG